MRDFDLGRGRPGAIADPRHRGEQSTRIGPGRRSEQRRRRRLLDHAAFAHHHDPIRHLGHDAHVMCDQHQARPAIAVARA